MIRFTRIAGARWEEGNRDCSCKKGKISGSSSLFTCAGVIGACALFYYTVGCYYWCAGSHEAAACFAGAGAGAGAGAMRSIDARPRQFRLIFGFAFAAACMKHESHGWVVPCHGEASRLEHIMEIKTPPCRHIHVHHGHLVQRHVSIKALSSSKYMLHLISHSI